MERHGRVDIPNCQIFPKRFQVRGLVILMLRNIAMVRDSGLVANTQTQRLCLGVQDAAALGIFVWKLQFFVCMPHAESKRMGIWICWFLDIISHLQAFMSHTHKVMRKLYKCLNMGDVRFHWDHYT